MHKYSRFNVNSIIFINHMNIIQLKSLIKEVIREVESDVADPKSNTDQIPKSLQVKNKGEEMVLKMTLRGVKPGGAFKKLMTKMAKDAALSDVEVLKSELIGKTGSRVASLSPEDIDSIERQVGKSPEDSSDVTSTPNKPLPKGWKKTPPSPDVWNHMDAKEREEYLIPASHKDEWDAAAKADAGTAKQRTAKDTNPKADLGSYNFGRNGKLPKNINLWTKDDWFTWEKLQPGDKKMVKFMIPNKNQETWTDDDWKNWEKFNPTQSNKVQFNIPRYSPVD